MIKRCSLNIIKRKIVFKISKNINEKYISKLRKDKLKNHNITIISNNCWAGWVYRRYNLPYLSPTIGLFIMPDDYIKFISNLNEYLSLELRFIKACDSKYKDFISKIDNRFGSYPIGKLNDIEIHFLHYKTEEEAYIKWNRRVKRVDYNNIIVKFNDQNECTKRNVEHFRKLNYYNKIFFTANLDYKYEEAIYIKEYEKYGFVVDDMLFSSKYINLSKYLNNIKKKEES